MNFGIKTDKSSGGVGVFIKSDLVKNNLVSKFNEQTTLNNVLWFKLHKTLCGIDIMCGAIYVEPGGSGYAVPNVFETLENDMIIL